MLKAGHYQFYQQSSSTQINNRNFHQIRVELYKGKANDSKDYIRWKGFQTQIGYADRHKGSIWEIYSTKFITSLIVAAVISLCGFGIWLVTRGSTPRVGP